MPKKLLKRSIIEKPSVKTPIISKFTLEASLLRDAHGRIKPTAGINERIILTILSFVPHNE